jgi:hypothetical protein
VKDALLGAIDEMTKTSSELMKASEEYYFSDVSWRVSHDVCESCLEGGDE